MSPLKCRWLETPLRMNVNARSLLCHVRSFLEELEKTVALFAFEDVKGKKLLDVSQQLKTASEMNGAIYIDNLKP